MSQKITLPGLVAELALRSGESKKYTEDFLKSLFSLIADCLADGESVKVRGLGVFKVIDVEPRKSVDISSGKENVIPAHRKITFVPVKEVANAVNAPFEMFHTMEIPDEMADSFNSQSEETGSIYLLDESIDDTIELDESTVDSTLSGESDDTFDAIEVSIDSTEVMETDEVVELVEKDRNNADDESDKSDSLDESDEDATSDKSEESEDIVNSDVPRNLEDSDESRNAENLVETGITADRVDAIETVDSEGDIDTEDGKYVEDAGENNNVSVERKRSRFWIGFISGALVALICGIAGWLVGSYCSGYQINKFNRESERVKDAESLTMQNIVISDSIIANDTISVDDSISEVKASSAPVSDDVVPTSPSDQKTYDTISKTRYLTTMAKDHYGNYHLWPYIYIENERILGHPNHIRPGTQVVIPDLKKYGVDPKNPADIAKAKQKGAEIYSRYN